MSTLIPVGDVMVEMIDHGDAIVRMTNNGKLWEPATRAAWWGLVKPDDLVIDVGAYTGVYSIASALMGAKVIAIEPHPANFQRLRANAALNSVRIEMHEAAASRSRGQRILSMKRDASVLCDTASLEFTTVVESMTVQTIRIDDLKLSTHVSLIKLDIEHHEKAALAGALRTISTHRPIIIVEVLSEQEHFEMQHMLGMLGYRCSLTLDHRNRLYSHQG